MLIICTICSFCCMFSWEYLELYFVAFSSFHLCSETQLDFIYISFITRYCLNSVCIIEDGFCTVTLKSWCRALMTLLRTHKVAAFLFPRPVFVYGFVSLFCHNNNLLPVLVSFSIYKVFTICKEWMGGCYTRNEAECFSLPGAMHFKNGKRSLETFYFPVGYRVTQIPKQNKCQFRCLKVSKMSQNYWETPILLEQKYKFKCSMLAVFKWYRKLHVHSWIVLLGRTLH